MKTPIDENTLIPLGLAILAIGGGAAWLTKISLQSSANASMLQEISQKQDKYTEHVAAIRQDIAVIRSEITALKEARK